MAKKFSNHLFLVLSLIVLNGCVNGLLYTDIVRPLTENMDRTPRSEVSGEANLFRIRDPITSVRLSAEWNSYAIGDAAKAQGIDNLNYADIKTYSLIGGLFTEKTTLVWGDKVKQNNMIKEFQFE